MRLSIFESAVCLLKLSIEKDGRSTCRRTETYSLFIGVTGCTNTPQHTDR